MKRDPVFMTPEHKLSKKRSVSFNDQVLHLLEQEAQRTASNISQVIRVCVLRTLGGGKAA